ncbi:putative metalloprotease ARX1 [Debaryomyces fabryi]|uniref:Probable metalloprotease ARX1 n=1 Tax=Debaryomyces fabryi TaxID=58627 RepID=A0A0V1PS07_9ASCO|nr:putative metalloprotease ARX1 [Debaryomyces fabryi]KRZ98930.1 putative metalloprotease ARX1 [Debaryomyces fabryi]CUM46723.1 unnamed protein product [Debaryomyces fabryi]
MQLAVHQDDADILLKEKNQLNESILDKYRVAGQIAQTGLKYVISLINDSYHFGKTEAPYTCQELCVMGDSMLTRLLAKVYNTEIREKGISNPVSIELNEIVGNFAPEIDDASKFTFGAGDIVTVTLGVHIDGYAANVSHTVVIYPPGVTIDNELKPPGPLLGSKADSICAAHIATETVVALLGLALTPEKLPTQLDPNNTKLVTGKQIRDIVNSIAESFNCTVVPGSKVRRIRRFLAGQAEGVVAEKDFKGVVWGEADQEELLLNKYNKNDDQQLVLHNKQRSEFTNNSSAIPTDEFVVAAGEVYNVDIKMCSTSEFKELGLVTLEEIDEFTGVNNKTNEFKTKSTIYIRDYAVNYQLRLKNSRSLLGKIDKEFTVFPFKLSHTSPSYPVTNAQDLATLKKELVANKLGLSELANRHLINAKPIQVTKFIPFETILKTSNPSGKHGIDSNKPALPGMEIPLPNLGISSLKLKSLLKNSSSIANARELTTVILNSFNNSNEVIRLTGGNNSAPCWVHSDYLLNSHCKESVDYLLQLSKDKRFGIKVKECQPMKLAADVPESMQMD